MNVLMEVEYVVNMNIVAILLEIILVPVMLVMTEFLAMVTNVFASYNSIFSHSYLLILP